MNAELIPSEFWKEYDIRKASENSDAAIFGPEHPWELNYLIKGIREKYPQYTETVIFLSIRNAIRLTAAPRKREIFVQYVLRDLLQRQPCVRN